MISLSTVITFIVCLHKISMGEKYGLVNAGKEDQEVKFYHYLQDGSFEQVNVDDFHSLNTNKDAPLYIVIDGFLSNFEASMSQTVKNSIFIKRSNGNVIIVDWSKLSGFDSLQLHDNTKFAELMMVYNIAKSKVGLVGKEVAKFLGKLVGQNVTDFSRVHVIGFSLGAHIAGISGWHVIEKYRGMITRITGLDPAGPGFSMQDMRKRLDKTDAEFVDIYYSNRYIAGDVEHRMGHVDVYLNGGKTQPGCTSPSLIMSTICNHAYSWKAWNKCSNEKCKACPCHSPECQNCNGECSNGITVGMDISMDITGDYYLKLGSILS